VRALLALAALLVVLSPGVALAHGGADHGARAPQLQESGSGLFAERHAWSPACPPGPGHVCGCGNLSLCDGSGKTAAATVRCTVSFLPPASSGAVPLHEAPAQSAPQFAPNSPRAPPAFS